MFRFYLNIRDKASPVVGGGWIEVSPAKEGVALDKSLENDQIFARLKMTGNIELLGEDFNPIDELRVNNAKVQMRVTYTDNLGNTEIVYRGDLGLWGEYAENKCILKAEPDDEYKEVDIFTKEKYNILNTPGIVKCDIAPSTQRLTFYDSAVDFSSIWYTFNYSPYAFIFQDTYAREEKTYPDHLADIYLEADDGWGLISDNNDGTKTIGRTWQDAGFAAPTSGNFKFFFYDVSNPYPLNSQVVYQGNMSTVVNMSTSLGIVYVMDNDLYYGASPITFDKFRRLDEVIKFIFSQMDDTILFDDDSFSYLEENEDLTNLLVINISDMMLADATHQTTIFAEYGYYTWEKLSKLLREKFKIYWKLEAIAGVYYFRLKHRSEVNYTLGTIDLTAYGTEGRNWCRDLWKYNNEKKFNRLVREPSEADNIDFLGDDITVPMLDNVEKEQKISDDGFFYDVWHIIQAGSEIYPASSDNEFCMVAADIIETDGVDLLTGMNNSGFEIFNYSAGTLVVDNTSGNAMATSVAHTTVPGYIYKVVLNLTSLTGSAPIFDYVSSVNATNKTLSLGVNTFYCIPGNSGYAGNNVITITANGVSAFTIEDMIIERQVYTCRIEEGALSGEQVANVELSTANLDAGHAQYEMPAQEVYINGVATTMTSLQRVKDKEQEIEVPIFNPADIDPEKLIKTNKGNIEFRSINIKMDGSMPSITGAFV